MKKTVFSDSPGFIIRKFRGIGAAALSATALVSALSLAAPLRADEAADRKIAADLNRKGFDLLQLTAEKDAKKKRVHFPVQHRQRVRAGLLRREGPDRRGDPHDAGAARRSGGMRQVLRRRFEGLRGQRKGGGPGVELRLVRAEV